jgi:hypothetical protein
MGNTCCKEDYLDDDEYRYPCKKINFKDMYLISIYENQESVKNDNKEIELEQVKSEIKSNQPEIEQNQEINTSINKVDDCYETNSDDSYEILSNEHFENEL